MKWRRKEMSGQEGVRGRVAPLPRVCVCECVSACLSLCGGLRYVNIDVSPYATKLNEYGQRETLLNSIIIKLLSTTSILENGGLPLFALLTLNACDLLKKL